MNTLEMLRRELSEYENNASKGSYNNRKKIMRILKADIARLEAIKAK